MMRTCTCANQGVRNVTFSEYLAYVLNGWSHSNLPLDLKKNPNSIKRLKPFHPHLSKYVKMYSTRLKLVPSFLMYYQNRSRSSSRLDSRNLSWARSSWKDLMICIKTNVLSIWLTQILLKWLPKEAPTRCNFVGRKTTNIWVYKYKNLKKCS